MEDTYERTYSQGLLLPSFSSGDRLPSSSAANRPSATGDDYAIACALAGIAEQQQQQPAPADTSMDQELAFALHEREASKLLRPPGKRVRRRSRALRSMLNHLKPTRVIPRVNPLLHPGASYVSEDRSRLLCRLDLYGLTERSVDGDGNCQFRALADQLYYSQARHAEVRQAVVDQLCCFPERYRDFVVNTDYKEYVSSMSRLGTWGDHVCLQAAADAFHVGINIITSFLDNCVITISPVVDEQQQQQPDVAEEVRQQAEQLKQQQEQQAEAKGPQEQAMQQLQHEAMPPTQELQQLEHPTSPLVEDCITLWLSFWAEVHYNSLAPKSSADGSVDDASEDSSSSEDEGGSGRHKLLGSARLGRLFGA